MSAPEPTAGERSPFCRREHDGPCDVVGGGHGWTCVADLELATPDAKDASTEACCQYAPTTGPCPAHDGPEVSEGPTDADREAIRNTVENYACTHPVGGPVETDGRCSECLAIATPVYAEVERIVAAREAKARADERERIAQAIESMECPGNPPKPYMRYAFETARDRAARIARGDA